MKKLINNIDAISTKQLEFILSNYILLEDIYTPDGLINDINNGSYLFSNLRNNDKKRELLRYQFYQIEKEEIINDDNSPYPLTNKLYIEFSNELRKRKLLKLKNKVK